MPTTLTRRRPLRFTCGALLEQLPSGRSPVDREAGVIRGCKILGPVSGNGRTYDLNGIDPAVYEGVPVNVDHPDARTGTRVDPAEDRLGRLVRPYKTEAGIFADLEVLTAHPMADRLFEAAERMPTAFGLSHNVAQGDYETSLDGGTVTRIRKVASVDLVADPATNTGLFESLGHGGPAFDARAFAAELLGESPGPRLSAFDAEQFARSILGH